MSNPEYLDEKQCTALMVKIAKLLNGAPISQAQYILNETQHLICECHAVDIENPRFKSKLDELAKSGVSFD